MNMNINEFKKECKELDFPIEAINSLSEVFEKILSIDESAGMLEVTEKEYSLSFIPGGIAQRQFDFENLCEKYGIHSYQAQMIFYIVLIPCLRAKYVEKNIPMSIFRDSMADLRCKLYECYNVYGIWGSFVAVWFSRFFNFTLYGIGRLEFVPYGMEFDFESQKNGFIAKGEPVIDVHIPSKGRLPHDEVIASYKAALDFFKNHLHLSPRAFVCESWMLFPKHREIIPECRNIIDFMNDYELTELLPGEGMGDLWRIFNTNDYSDISKLPRDTYMQRQYADFLMSGGIADGAKGIFFVKDLK